jgi:hypothetical protein
MHINENVQCAYEFVCDVKLPKQFFDIGARIFEIIFACKLNVESFSKQYFNKLPKTYICNLGSKISVELGAAFPQTSPSTSNINYIILLKVQ